MNEPCLKRAVTVARNKIVRKDGKKYLAVGLVNRYGESLTAVRLNVSRFASDGNPLPPLTVYSGGLNEKKDARFVLLPKTELGEACASCSVAVEAASYGDYTFTESDGKTTVSYTGDEPPVPGKAELLFRTGGRTRSVSRRVVKTPFMLGIISIALLIIVGVIMFFQLQSFTSSATSFLRSGVEFTFVRGDRSEGSEIIVTGFNGLNTDVYIPEEVEGHPVISVADKAFSGNNRITSLKVEGSPTVGEYAFENCLSLESVDLGNVTEVGKRAFARSGITELVSEKLTFIGEEAFSRCTSLEKVELGSTSVSGKVSIGRNAFSYCTALTDFAVNKIAEYPSDYTILRGCDLLGRLKLFNFNYTPFEPGASGKLTLKNLSGGTRFSPDSVEISNTDGITKEFSYGIELDRLIIGKMDSTAIGDYAFANTGIKSLSLPRAVTSIGNYAFMNTEIESFDMTMVEKLGGYAFDGCSALRFITVPAGITEIPSGAFRNCTNLGSVAFTDGTELTSIDTEAFSGCSALRSINLPLSLERISEKAFSHCTSLKSFVLPTSVTSVGRGILAGCNAIEEYEGNLPPLDRRLGYFFSDPDSGSYYDNNSVPASLKKVKIAEGTFFVAPETFYECKYIETVILPSSLASIGDSAFWHMPSLEKIDLPDGLTSIDARAFGNCVNLKELTVPDSVETMGREMLFGCFALEELTVPFIGQSRTSASGYTNWFFNDYGSGAYGAPASLKKISVTDSEIIRGNAFSDARYVEEVTLASGVRSIGGYAFSDCVALKKMILPDTVSSISDGAFTRCFSLYEVYNLSESLRGRITAGSTDFGGVAHYALIVSEGAPGGDIVEYVTIGNYEFARVGDNWSLIAYTGDETSLAFGSFTYNFRQFDYSIGGGVFDSESAVESVRFGPNVTGVRSYAFSGCCSLRRVDLPSHFTAASLGDNAFGGCGALFEVYNRSSVDIRAGLYDNYGLGLSSVAVYTEEKDAPPGVDVDGFIFRLFDDKWYLVSYSGTSRGIIELPESFEYRGSEVNEYTVRPYIMPNMTVDGFIVPKSATQISESAFVTKWYARAVLYYMGSEAELSDAFGGWHYYTAYFYTDGCVHEPGQWTFAGGKVTTEIKPVEGERITITEPTCTENGWDKIICDDCGYETLLYVSALGHDYKDGVCTRCGKAAEARNGEDHA